jgi:hypothetical protein
MPRSVRLKLVKSVELILGCCVTGATDISEERRGSKAFASCTFKRKTFGGVLLDVMWQKQRGKGKKIRVGKTGYRVEFRSNSVDPPTCLGQTEPDTIS